jgi:hypothetical protein
MRINLGLISEPRTHYFCSSQLGNRSGAGFACAKAGVGEFVLSQKESPSRMNY